MTADGIGAASMAALSLRAAVATGDADRIEAAWHATGPAERTDPALLRELADAAERCGRAALLDEALQAATALAPDDLWLHVRYVRAARERPDPRLALARTDRFLAFHPEAGLIHVMRGEALLDLDEAAEAEESFREAVRIEPTLVWSHVRYAGSARARGDAEAWLHRLQAGFLVLPDDPLIARELADALSESGRTREARRLLADALAANPGDAELRQRLDRPAAPPSGRYSGAIGVLVSRDPAIICSAVYSFEPVVDAVMPLYQARGQPVTFLFESLQSIVFHEVLRARFPRQVAGLQARHPLARIRFLVNDLHELEVARAVGLDSEIINNNAFVDEDVYRILPDTPKRYDAVYNARLHPYKRHELATRLERLLLLVADPEPEQLARCRALLP
ncbi:MAG: tetratricopeptide repeat protein, partial [Acetobacteraceae bacterium]|nr:tetratricopeptide repeat protein [Acetobacteraceae bacterium]